MKTELNMVPYLAALIIALGSGLVVTFAAPAVPATILTQWLAAHRNLHPAAMMLCVGVAATAFGSLIALRKRHAAPAGPRDVALAVDAHVGRQRNLSAKGGSAIASLHGYCGDTQRRRAAQPEPAGGAWRAALRSGLNSAQFVPFYQPIVALTTGGIVGMEVLARWNHPAYGLLAPDRFIHLMEAERLCADLSLCLLGQVIEDARAWPPHWSFAFNASAGQLHELLEFVSRTDRAADAMLDPRRIELEITETVLIEDMELARAVVRAVHGAGARVVLDDFGTGYANVLQLRALPFDRIKIDRGFVTDLITSTRTQACVHAMLGLAHNLGATVIAEGVEDEPTACKLRDMGCDFAQGFHYAPPMPAAAVPGLAWRKAAA